MNIQEKIQFVQFIVYTEVYANNFLQTSLQAKTLFAVIQRQIQVQRAENTKKLFSYSKDEHSPRSKCFDCFAYILFQYFIAPNTKNDITSPGWPNASFQSWTAWQSFWVETTGNFADRSSWSFETNLILGLNSSLKSLGIAEQWY